MFSNTTYQVQGHTVKRCVSEKIIEIVGQMLKHETRMIFMYERVQKLYDKESVLGILGIKKLQHTDLCLSLLRKR